MGELEEEMNEKLNQTNPVSRGFNIVRSEMHHHRLFAWGNWEGADEDGAGLRIELSPDNSVHWFAYHENMYSEVEDDSDEVHEELEYPTLSEDGYLILKDVSGLLLRVVLLNAGPNTNIEFRLI